VVAHKLLNTEKSVGKILFPWQLGIKKCKGFDATLGLKGTDVMLVKNNKITICYGVNTGYLSRASPLRRLSTHITSLVTHVTTQ
jgi:hypothetical protein